MVLGNCVHDCICKILMLKFWHILDRLFSFHCVLEFLSCFSMVRVATRMLRVLQVLFLALVLLLVLPLVLLLQLVVIHLLARLLQLY